MARRFGHTWWGRAWVHALEERASLDPNRLPRGRTYARKELAELGTTEPGRVRATVRGSRDEPYAVEVRLRPFDDEEWDRLYRVVVAKAGRVAALLDGELDPDLVDDARVAGIELLPDSGELRTWCSCPDWAEPCKHAAAVCYLVADTLDADPFALLHLRGAARDDVLAEVRRRRSAGGGSHEAANPGAGNDGIDLRTGSSEPAAGAAVGDRDGGAMDAGAAWRRERGRLPDPPPLPARAGRWLAPATAPPAGVGFDLAGLTMAADDAARRALGALAGAGLLDLGEPTRSDAARLAARLAGDTRSVDRLASATGRSVRQLLRAAIAWTVAGGPGVDVVEDDRWRPDPLLMAVGRARLDDLHPGRSLRVDGNRITAGDHQYRLGRDRRWYRLTKQAGAWLLADGPADDPTDLVDRGDGDLGDVERPDGAG